MHRRWAVAALVLACVLACGGWLLFGARGRKTTFFTPASTACFDAASEQATYTYCIYRPAGGSNGGLVYHFHGRGHDARQWNDATLYTGSVQAQWEALAVRPPIVVSVSFGPEWLLLPDSGSPGSGKLSAFLDEIMPKVEQQTGVPRYRVLLGASMGGLNALLAALHAPHTFDRVVALCPPLYRLQGMPTLGDVWHLSRRTGAKLHLTFGLFFKAKRYLKTEQDKRAVAVFSLLEALPRDATQTLHLSCGLEDEYGNFEGVLAF